jgi:hypothetical protein
MFAPLVPMERAMKADPEFVKTLRNPRWQIAGAMAVITIIVVALLGGFREAKPHLPHFGPGQQATTPALAVTLAKAWIDTRGVNGYEDTLNHQHYLVLDAVVTNLTNKSNNWYLRNDLIWIIGQGAGQKTVKADAIYLAGDHTLLDNLQPQLPTHVLIAWKIAPETTVGSSLQWGLYSRHYLAKAYISNESGWLQDKPAAMFTVPVEDRRDSHKVAAW